MNNNIIFSSRVVIVIFIVSLLSCSFSWCDISILPYYLVWLSVLIVVYFYLLLDLYHSEYMSGNPIANLIIPVIFGLMAFYVQSHIEYLTKRGLTDILGGKRKQSTHRKK
jgi:hypothetical protein